MKKELKIYLASPRGFCAGVKRAIDIVEKSINKFGSPVYVRHEIVHNKQVVEELKGASKKHLSQAVRIDKLDLENKTLDTICDELRAASKMHLGQSKRVQAHIGMMEGEATDAAKELIDREKERMKDKHDRIMQRAKIKDVTDASREKQGEN